MARRLLFWLWFVACIVGGIYGVARLLRHQTGWDPNRLFDVRPEFADVVARLDLELDLRAPPRFAGKARLTLRAPTTGRVWLLLNRSLDVQSAADEQGRAVAWSTRNRVRSDYHREARALAFDLAAPARELRIDYVGNGADGTEQRDWMGVLRMAPDELRMSPQTVFYPQLPLEFDGPRPRAWPTRLTVLTPAEFEAYAPGQPQPCEPPSVGRAWCFASATPTVLSLFAAPRVRRETLLGDARFVTLLREPHAALGEPLARDAESVLRFYSDLWGPVGAQSLGLVEFVGRGASYNWASQGILAFETGAFAGSVPLESLAHEIAHLWWGQEVAPFGRGERLLTEGLAEFAAWRYLASVRGAAAGDAAARAARDDWWATVHDTGVDPGGFDVRFGQPGYQELAYAKGPAALWALQAQLGPERMDAALRAYRKRAGNTAEQHSSATFVAALREVAGTTPLDLSAFENAGHLHAALADVEFAGDVVRGRVVATPCAKGLPPASPPRATLLACSESGIERRDVDLGAPFEVRAATPILAVRLDLAGQLGHAHPATILAPGLGLRATEPTDGTTDCPLGRTALQLHFGTPLDPLDAEVSARIEAATRRQARAAKTGGLRVASAALTADARTLTLEITDTSPQTDYVLIVPDATLRARGLPLPEVTLRFQTRDAHGIPKPTIVSSDPPAGARDVPINLPRVRVVFSAPMRKGRGFRTDELEALSAAGAAYPEFGASRWEDARTLVWDIAAPLLPGRRYALPFGAGYCSELGVGVERFDLQFETTR